MVDESWFENNVDAGGHTLSSQEKGQSGRSASRRRKWLWIAGLALGAIILGVIILVLAIGTYAAYLKPLPVPHPRPISSGLITARSARDNLQQVDSTGVTSHSLSSEPVQPHLFYAPLIPDAADIPQKIREQSRDLNQRFDDIFRMMAQYELEKSHLSSEEMLTSLNRIDSEYKDALTRLWSIYRINGPAAEEIMKPDGLKGFFSNHWDGKYGDLVVIMQPDAQPQGNLAKFLLRLSAYPEWKRQSTLEAYEKGGRWKDAALLAREMGDLHWTIWSTSHSKGWGDTSLIRHQDYQADAARAWDMEAYYWRQCGGSERFYRITVGTVARQYERFYQHTSGVPFLKRNLPKTWPYSH